MTVTTKDNLLLELIGEHSTYNTPRIRAAFSWAYDLHATQLRKSGEPYIIHPTAVAQQLMEIGMDEDSIIAGLLHDVIEDCGVKYEEIKENFGVTVADLVLAETKVDDLTSNAYLKFSDYNNLKRMLIAMTDDVRVIIIRLSDRLHNMKTIQYLKPERQITYSQETLNVYVPLAEYINIGVWKRELENIAFNYVYPNEAKLLTELINKDPRSNPKNIDLIQNEIEELMHKNKIPCEISGRVKSIPSLFNKMKKYIEKGKLDGYKTEGVNDILAFRIITTNNNSLDCYKALGAIHSKYDYIPERFDDYISKPKDNGYQSLQTDVYINNLPVEIQIRTQKMHEFNEFGSAAHISYKQKGSRTQDNAFNWVKNLVKWQNSKGSKSFSIQNVLSDKIFVFTPKGQVIEMQRGATVIDFAYRIHTKVGNSCTGAKVNGKIFPLDTKIKTGDVIEILTSKSKEIPNKEWTNFCLPKTAAIIKREISRRDIEAQIESGKTMFKNRVREAGLTIDNKGIDVLVNDFAGGIEDEFYRRIDLKMINLTHLINTLLKSQIQTKEGIISKETLPIKAVTASNSVILVRGHKGMQYYMAKCCNPTEANELVGFISLEHGVTVHKKDCKVVQYLDKERLVDVDWGVQ